MKLWHHLLTKTSTGATDYSNLSLDSWMTQPSALLEKANDRRTDALNTSHVRKRASFLSR